MVDELRYGPPTKPHCAVPHSHSLSSILFSFDLYVLLGVYSDLLIDDWWVLEVSGKPIVMADWKRFNAAWIVARYSS